MWKKSKLSDQILVIQFWILRILQRIVGFDFHPLRGGNAKYNALLLDHWIIPRHFLARVSWLRVGQLGWRIGRVSTQHGNWVAHRSRQWRSTEAHDHESVRTTERAAWRSNGWIRRAAPNCPHFSRLTVSARWCSWDSIWALGQPWRKRINAHFQHSGFRGTDLIWS